MEVRQIDPHDEAALARWCALWRLTDIERWPDLIGWGPREIRAMATHGGAVEHRLVAVIGEADGSVHGIGMLEIPRRDNVHSIGIDVRVHPAHRRQGIGTVIVDTAVQLARVEGRSTLNSYFDVPIEQVGHHPSGHFAAALGFEDRLAGNGRRLAVPMPAAHAASLRAEVAQADGATDYRLLTFVTPWPDEFMDDQCELARRMSTDQPQGDAQSEEEQWDAARVEASDALLAQQGMKKLAAVAQHIESGRLVAFTEIVVSDVRPLEAWQWATLVLREHRGHRLGLAVKVANLELLTTVHPTARFDLTGNAQENAPMIAVNEMMGFEVVSSGVFRQKELGLPS